MIKFRSRRNIRSIFKFAALLISLLGLSVPFLVVRGQSTEKANGTTGAKNLDEYIQGKPFNVGAEWVVLADDYYLEDKIGVRRVIGHVLKSPNNPLVSADQPWEDSINWASVIYDKKAGLYHMWYTVSNSVAYHLTYEKYPSHSPERAQAILDANRKHFYAYFVCYANSKDGKHWEKPELNIYSFLDFDKTNIVMVGQSEVSQTNYWLNEDESDPARRFLMTYTDGHDAPPDPDKKVFGESFMLAYSADGIHWQIDHKVSPLLTHDVPDGSYQTLFDKEHNRWLLYRRPDYHSAAAVRSGVFANVRPQRRYGVAFNDRLGAGWTYPALILVPDESVDRRDIDTLYVFREGTDYLAMLGEMDDSEDGLQEVHLAVSHDGVHWNWFSYLPPLIPRGPSGSWDAGQIQPPKSIVPRGQYVYLYYTGVNEGQRMEAGYDSHIGMARIRTGRWIGLAAGADGGFVLTRQLIVTGKYLQLNSQAINTPYMAPIEGRGVGYIKVELMRRDDVTQKLHPIPGFTFAESDPLVGDFDDGVVTWKGKGDLSSIRGTPVYIRLHVVQSELWEMRFANE